MFRTVSLVALAVVAPAGIGCAGSSEEPVETKAPPARDGKGSDEPSADLEKAVTDGENSVTPQVNCRRLLRKCLAGPDPRSFECDSWVVLC